MSRSNINIKEGFSKTSININTNIRDSRETQTRVIRARHVQATAKKLSETFENETSYNFFLKAAWRLPESKIWQNVETAKSAKPRNATDSSLRFFIYLCKVDGV